MALLLLEALGKGQGVGSPLGFLGRTSAFGEILLWALDVAGVPWVLQPRLHTVPVRSFLSQVSDKGLYSCKANNVAGEAVRTFVLTVQGKPGTSP